MDWRQSTSLVSGMGQFQLLVESVKDYAIFILDPSGQVTTWNAGAARIKRYTAEEIVGKHFSTFYPREDVAAGKCERELEVAAREGISPSADGRKRTCAPLWPPSARPVLRRAESRSFRSASWRFLATT